MIRHATLADVPRLVEMGRRFHAEAYQDTLAENPTQMAVMARRLITDEHGVIFVAETDGRLVGMIGMLVYAHHLSAEWTAGEVMWWIEPEARGSGVRLLKAAEAWARDQGAQKIQMIAPNARVGTLYTRLGYVPIEVAYQKAVA